MKILLLLLALASGIINYSSLPADGNPPPKRTYSRMSYISSKDALISFGGYEDITKIYDELWIYYISTKQWKMLEPIDINKPCNSYTAERYNHGTFSLALEEASYTESEYGDFCVFGGSNSKGYMNDVWCYDLSARRVTFT